MQSSETSGFSGALLASRLIVEAIPPRSEVSPWTMDVNPRLNVQWSTTMDFDLHVCKSILKAPIKHTYILPHIS